LKIFIKESNIHNISEEIVRQCISIRKGKKIKIPDAIIAATAVVNKFSLITANETDFIQISGLKIINPAIL